MDVMMPVVAIMMVPVVAPMAIVADAARAVMGQDHPTAAVRIIIGVIVIRVIGRAIEEAPVKVMVVRKSIAAVSMAAAMEDRSGAKPAAMEYGATTVEAAAVKTSAAMETATAVEASAATAMEATATAVETSSTTAMSTADFCRQPVGGKFRRGDSARIDQRERLCALRNG